VFDNMHIGIFAKTFVRRSLEETLDAVKEHGLDLIQLNMSCLGLPTLPEKPEWEAAEEAKRTFDKKKITVCAVSGTYNMAHPDPQVRRRGLDRLKNLAAVCRAMGTPVITLCTGSRDPDNMWRFHPGNAAPEAWEDLVFSMEEALAIADEYQLTLAIEPEPANVVSNAERAKTLLDLMQSPRLKVVMDAANLFGSGNRPDMRGEMDRAFDLLGDHIILAHAKDVAPGDTLLYVAAGQGVLDYDHYLSLLKQCPRDVPLILHGLDESRVPESVAFLQDKLNKRE